jgi:hypothetical protein
LTASVPTRTTRFCVLQTAIPRVSNSEVILRVRWCCRMWAGRVRWEPIVDLGRRKLALLLGTRPADFGNDRDRTCESVSERAPSLLAQATRMHSPGWHHKFFLLLTVALFSWAIHASSRVTIATLRSAQRPLQTLRTHAGRFTRQSGQCQMAARQNARQHASD